MRDIVLGLLKNEGKITEVQYQAALAEPIVTRTPQSRSEENYAMDLVRRELDAILEEEDIRLGGLVVHTTLDLDLQNATLDAINKHMEALEADPSLIEFGAENKVILSTPSTLIALLKAVAYGWKQEQLADNAKKISEAGADLFNTCSILTGHFSSLGKSLNQAVTQYNKTVSSFEHRFIPRAQKLKNLGVTSTKDLPGSLEDITVQAKSADIPDIPS